LRPRTSLTKAGNAGVDQTRVKRAQGLVVHTQPLCDAGTRVLDEDVGSLHERIKRLTPLFRLQIQRYRALVAIEREEAGAILAFQAEAHRLTGGVTGLGRLDLDHVRTHVG